MSRDGQSRHQQDIERSLAGEKWQDLGIIFPNTIGKPMDLRNLTRQFKKLLQQAGLPDIRFHDLRHSAATLMLLEGIHPKIVSERLRHSDVYITLNLYTNSLPTLQKDAAEKLDELLTPIQVEMSVSEEHDARIINLPSIKENHLHHI